MTERERDTAFLRKCLGYDNSAERHQLEGRIDEVQRNERCVGRAVKLMALLTLFAGAAICYATVFRDDYPKNLFQFTTPLFIKVSCALGVGSLICTLAFGGLGVIYRWELEKRRQESRRMVAELLESRLGAPAYSPSQRTGRDKEPQQDRAGDIRNGEAVQPVS